MKKKLFSGLILTAFILASCGGETAISEQTTASDTVETPDGETSRFDAVDLGGEKLTALIRSEFAYEFDVDSETGDVVSDAVYNRNKAVEELLNIELDFVKVDGNWSSRDTFKSAISSSVLANDGAYDTVFGALNQLMPYVADGFFVNLLEQKELDFEREHWFAGFTENMTVNGRLYGAVGDAAMTMLENLCVVMFNKNIADEYKLPDMYSLVKDNEWTLDKFMSLSKGVTSDLDGDGEYTDDDLYGYMTTGIMFRACCASFELPVTVTGTDGLPELSMGSEKHIEAFEKLKHFVTEGDPVYISTGNTEQTAEEMRRLFGESKALFMWQTLNSAQVLRQMESDFGILPYPKYDKSQDKYYSQALETHTVLTIPISAKSLSNSAYLLEALGETSYASVTPAYYDIALNVKFTRDEQSAEMLEIIRDGICYNFGFVNSVAMDQVGAIFGNITLSSFNLSTSWASNQNKYNTLLDTLIEFYK